MAKGLAAGRIRPALALAGESREQRLSSVPQNKVTIIPVRHSRMLVAGIQKESLDARLRGHDGCKLDTQLCGAALSTAPHKFGIRNTAHPARHSREGGNPDGSASLWTPAFVGVTFSTRQNYLDGALARIFPCSDQPMILSKITSLP